MCVLLLAGCQPKENKRLDTDFEGKIIYTMSEWEAHGPDSAKWELFRVGFSNDSMICYIDEGRFFSILNGTHYEYQYLDPHTNKGYIKIQKRDTLLLADGAKSLPGESPLLDVSQELNTDTILGYVCNKLILKFKNETRTYFYSPELSTNPEWYKQTRAMSTDVAYKHMKSYFLALKYELPGFSYTFRATNIFPGKVPADIFPKVEAMPQRPIY